jgi:NADPH:quinone reductase
MDIARTLQPRRRKRHSAIACTTVRAIQMTEFGGPEVLQLVELPKPEPGPGEVLVRVTRAGMNFADVHTRTNSYVQKATLPLVPGREVAGVREDTGERVIALVSAGGYAEYAKAPAELVFPIPEGLDDGVALALMVQGLTAWHLYRTAGQVGDGESVVVHAAAGGVGSLAVQLGKPLGAGRVIAVASSEEKRRLALGLGADVAVDSEPVRESAEAEPVGGSTFAKSAGGLQERLIEANGGKEVDVVFEMAGGAVFEASYRALAHFGRIVICGIASQEPNRVSTGSLLRHSRSVVGFYLFHCLGRPGMWAEPLAELFARAVSGELQATVGHTYPLSGAAQAQIDMRERRTTGKLLLDPSV